MAQPYILILFNLLLIGFTIGVSGDTREDRLQFDYLMGQILSNSNGSPDVESFKSLLVQAKEKAAGFDYLTSKLAAKDLEDLDLLLSVGMEATCSVIELNRMGEAITTLGVTFGSLTHYLNHFQRNLIDKCNARLHEEMSSIESDRVPNEWVMLSSAMNKLAPGYTTLEYLIGDVDDARSVIVENYEKILKSQLCRLKTPTEPWHEYYTTLKNSLEAFQKSICKDQVSQSLLQILPGFLHLDFETQYISNLDREKRATLERAVTCEYLNIVDKEKILDEFIVKNYDGATLYDLVFVRNEFMDRLPPEDIHFILSILKKYTKLTNEGVTRDMIGRKRVSNQALIPLDRALCNRNEIDKMNRFLSNENPFPYLKEYHQTYIPMYIKLCADKMIKSIEKGVRAMRNYDEFKALSEGFPNNIQLYLSYIPTQTIASGVAKFLLRRGVRLGPKDKLGFMYEYVREVCRAGSSNLFAQSIKLELFEDLKLDAQLEYCPKLIDLLGAENYQLLAGTFFCRDISTRLFLSERSVVQQINLLSHASSSQPSS